MKITGYILILVLAIISVKTHAQITRELQDAINSVPFAKFDYPANRDRNDSPEVASPQAFVFAYYRLPYAINLKPVYNDALGGYVEKVLLDFNSVDLSPAAERKMIQNELLKLQELIDIQVYTARMAGFADYTNFSRSYISQFFSNGRAVIAIRELMSSQDLFNKLVNRAKSL
jgi:hypothetical protein